MPVTPSSPRTPRRTARPYVYTPGTGSSGLTIEYLQTPSPEPSSVSSGGVSEYRPDVDMDMEMNAVHDIKPGVSDDDVFGSPVYTKVKGKNVGTSSATNSPKTKKSTAPNGGGGGRSTSRGGGGRKAGAWTPEQDWEMFKILHPKAKVDWASVANATGRDSKSCQNRWTLLSKKFESAIKGISA